VLRLGKRNVYLDTIESLHSFIARIAGATVLAVDTEFIRERSYYPQLCLIQLATEDECVAVDPLALDDLSPLCTLLQDPGIVKLFHAGSNDCAVIHHSLGIVPAPLFDTQLAANILGASHQIGLANLVQRYCDVHLNKLDSFSDWLRRPLSARQIEYALDDVRYLPRIYETMQAELAELGRQSWLEDDFAHMSNPTTYELDSEQLWRRVKRAQSMSSRQLFLVQALAAWRERIAQKKDLPRRWILSDEQLIEIVKREPRTAATLFEIRGIREKLGEHSARSLIRALNTALEQPEEQWPKREGRITRSAEYATSLDLMTALVHLRASENRVAAAVLADHDSLLRMVAGDHDDCEVLRGWRREIIGDDLLELLAGNIALHLKDGKLQVSPTPEQPVQ
jgi:ribonuclease D